ncbi:hypothetical protein T492DRAFT_882542 [Pavlovales sp. CCMP2436]|nr:hypothetical protein T492DRAFT_882542 [Pavlovales sp. CCMP2436]
MWIAAFLVAWMAGAPVAPVARAAVLEFVSQIPSAPSVPALPMVLAVGHREFVLGCHSFERYLDPQYETFFVFDAEYAKAWKLRELVTGVMNLTSRGAHLFVLSRPGGELLTRELTHRAPAPTSHKHDRPTSSVESAPHTDSLADEPWLSDTSIWTEDHLVLYNAYMLVELIPLFRLGPETILEQDRLLGYEPLRSSGTHAQFMHLPFWSSRNLTVEQGERTLPLNLNYRQWHSSRPVPFLVLKLAESGERVTVAASKPLWMNADEVREGDCVFKLLEVSDSDVEGISDVPSDSDVEGISDVPSNADVEGISDVPSNAFSLMTEPPRVKRTAELAAATEDDALATLSRILEDYSLPSVELQKGRVRGHKTIVPEEELTHVQKIKRIRNNSRSEKRREGGLWDLNVDGGGILQRGTGIRCYTLGHIGHHKGADGKYLGVADLPWLVKMLNALKDTDGYPRCSISGQRFTWNSDGEWPFSLNRIDNKDPSHGEDNVEVISARCNAVELEFQGEGYLRTAFTALFKEMLSGFTEPTLELAAERLNDEENVIARRQEIFKGGSLAGRKRIFKNIATAADHDAECNGWSNAHIKAFKELFGGYNGLLCCELQKKFTTQRGRCAYTGILLNGSPTSPFCLSLERLDDEICHIPLKLDKLGKPTVDFTNVVWIVRLLQVRNGWSRRIALTALLSSPTLERTREQEKLITDALSAAVA